MIRQNKKLCVRVLYQCSGLRTPLLDMRADIEIITTDLTRNLTKAAQTWNIMSAKMIKLEYTNQKLMHKAKDTQFRERFVFMTQSVIRVPQ